MGWDVKTDMSDQVEHGLWDAMWTQENIELVAAGEQFRELSLAQKL